MIYDPNNLLPMAHEKLQSLVRVVATKTDVQILTTYRNEAAQLDAYNHGYSKAKPGQSPHNFNPSLAVDMAPYPIDWKDIARFDALAVTVKETAKQIGVSITWGGDFRRIIDKPHFELLQWQQIVMQREKSQEAT